MSFNRIEPEFTYDARRELSEEAMAIKGLKHCLNLFCVGPQCCWDIQPLVGEKVEAKGTKDLSITLSVVTKEALALLLC